MPASSGADATPFRAIPPAMKLVLTLAVIILASLIPLEHWPLDLLLLAVTNVSWD